MAIITQDSTNQIIRLKARLGNSYLFDTSSSYDVDNDQISMSWWHYQEAGTYPGLIDLKNSALLNFEVPSDTSGTEIHLILEVKDHNKIASLHDYRRVVVEVDDLKTKGLLIQ